MAESFQPNGLPTLIGSLPLGDHEEAMDLILEHLPEIPLWPQLTSYRQEGMMFQFTLGLPGLCTVNGRAYVDTNAEGFDRELLQFFEDYIRVLDGNLDLDDSRFALKEDTTKGFFVFLERLRAGAARPTALKGQITGPFTLATGIADQNKRAIFYDPQLRDAVVKLLALKARWQVRRLSQFGRPVIIFFDEPGLAGVGSSEFTSISNDEIRQCFDEVFASVHQEDGLVGVHVCANTDWSLVLESAADIVSFDAYAYFDRFILYPNQIKTYLESEKILAWGIVPTLKPEEIERETTRSLMLKWEDSVRRIELLGFDAAALIRQSLITPSCGTGTLSLENTKKAIRLTREVSEAIRSR